ncbi:MULTISPECIES: ATP-binding protein [Streptomyces]|uniref:ATP-binding protein n=1 Tax=Streptomyces chengmaiensis TaxID=3040919 RepID=A0ABT6HYS4_9ACTN|nr:MULTISPECIES: ATP-binding protein [Streptomyces]MDH2393770.1 ATP-binding protein [Streptomyces chengmaiensis]WRQ78456.1 ATP-binding protein [Streptomyces sp. MUM 178J]
MNAEAAKAHVVIEASPHEDSVAARQAAAAFVLRNCPWADADAVLLVVSELVANVARHTAGWWRLHLSAGADALTVEMEDSSPLLPVPREPDLAGGGGFGWHMVLRLAGQVEVRPLPYGKRVQATWLRPAPAAAAEPATAV